MGCAERRSECRDCWDSSAAPPTEPATAESTTTSAEPTASTRESTTPTSRESSAPTAKATATAAPTAASTSPATTTSTTSATTTLAPPTTHHGASASKPAATAPDDASAAATLPSTAARRHDDLGSRAVKEGANGEAFSPSLDDNLDGEEIVLILHGCDLCRPGVLVEGGCKAPAHEGVGGCGEIIVAKEAEVRRTVVGEGLPDEQDSPLVRCAHLRSRKGKH